MALFQKAVVNKYLKQQDSDVVAKAYRRFVKYFHNPTIQQNIRERKEEQFQEGFLIELFVNVLNYTLAPNPEFNLTTELKNEKGAKKAGGEKLTKLQEMEWMEVFDTKKAKTQIDKTDNEIDAMVYELYGLSEDEIKIVKGND